MKAETILGNPTYQPAEGASSNYLESVVLGNDPCSEEGASQSLENSLDSRRVTLPVTSTRTSCTTDTQSSSNSKSWESGVAIKRQELNSSQQVGFIYKDYT